MNSRRAEPRRLHAGHHPPAASGCNITFQGGALSFQTCQEHPSGFIFHWNNLGDRIVQLAVTDQHVLGGWAGFGLGKQMIGSSVVAAFPTAGEETAPERSTTGPCFPVLNSDVRVVRTICWQKEVMVNITGR